MTNERSHDIAVSVRGLSKSYVDVAAVRGIDLEVRRGEIMAILGPNGAGKTTTIEILEGFRTRDAGEVTVLGHDPQKDRHRLTERVGIVLQSTGVDRFLTVTETVAMYASFYPHPRAVEEVIRLVGLEGKHAARVHQLSGGQQRRLDVAIALVGDPELLFLDEPTTGFDPNARREAWEVVKSLAELGKTIVLTTHYMDEAEYLADRVAIIVAGRVVALDSPDRLGRTGMSETRIRFRLDEAVALPAHFEARRCEDVVELCPVDATRTLHDLTAWSLESGIALEGLRVEQPSLEDIYLRLTANAGVTQ
jgi:ABC-2 type transport system ATP-binding protein